MVFSIRLQYIHHGAVISSSTGLPDAAACCNEPSMSVDHGISFAQLATGNAVSKASESTSQRPSTHCDNIADPRSVGVKNLNPYCVSDSSRANRAIDVWKMQCILQSRYNSSPLSSGKNCRHEATSVASACGE